MPHPTRVRANLMTCLLGDVQSVCEYVVILAGGMAAVALVAWLAFGYFGVQAAFIDDEVDHYLRRVEAERQSQEQDNDQAADEARVSAPEGPWNT